MRILIARHADPDYEHDSLTEVGEKEAQLLAKRLLNEEIDAFYVSPLGRAQKTAKATLDLRGDSAITYEWLQEFPALVQRPHEENKLDICWDLLPQDWCNEPLFYTDNWHQVSYLKEANIKELYDKVCSEFDKLLEEYGFIREGNLYLNDNNHHKTICLFCHFGIEAVLLSHLFNCSPIILLHHLCCAPASLTTVYTEERRKGIIQFRASSIGDCSHLYVEGLNPSFSARFCECYEDNTRHD